ncbi:MAG: OmpH family outer membrane protein [bacterium]|nr:OmpH family outer membrane protein [bacterium]
MMARRKWLLVGLGLGAAGLVGFGLLGRPAAGAEAEGRSLRVTPTIKVGTIDLSRAFKASETVNAARVDLVQERNRKLQALRARREELKSLNQELQNQRALLSEVVRRNKEGELRRKLRRLERFRNDSEQSLNRQFLSINRLFLADAKIVIDELGRDAGYTFIISVNNDLVLYGSQSVDVTDQLIQRMNSNQ